MRLAVTRSAAGIPGCGEVAHVRLDDLRDVVPGDVLARVLDGVGIDVDRRYERRSEFRGDDRQHARSGPDVDHGP